jgi:hypothetical protein
MNAYQSDNKVDLISGIVIVIFAAIIFWNTLSIPDSIYESLGASFLPRYLSLIIGLIGLWMIIKSIIIRLTSSVYSDGNPQHQSSVSEEFVKTPMLTVAGVILTLSYIASMQLNLLGFRSASFISIVLLGYLIAKQEPRTASKLRVGFSLVIIACIISIGCYYIFTKVFYTNLP